MQTTLDAIKKHNMIFVSAQPDSIYFHWQVELYLYQFAKHGPEIADRCYALLGYRGKPTAYAQELATKFKHVILYEDTRNLSVPNFYIPSIRPHLLKQFFAAHPDLGASVFYHDSDIFLVKLPRFELMLNDEISYVSDTISYIGYDYIKGCQERYKAVHKELPENDLINKMCDCVGISSELVKINQPNSGGAQYLLKNIDAAFWTEAETACQTLYALTKVYDVTHPIAAGLQIWTADMWIVLWLLWKRGSQTRLHKELDFSWGTYTAKDYHTINIFHLAGVTSDNCKGKFYKGAYTNKNVFKEYLRDKTIFDEIDKNNATHEYVAVLKEYAESQVSTDAVPVKDHSRFLLESKDAWSGVYTKDSATFQDRSLWRSTDRTYFIFYNGSGWILTHSQYEKEISTKMGGFASSKTEQPYECGWNQPCTIRLLD
jgi:hypothetical protein